MIPRFYPDNYTSAELTIDTREYCYLTRCEALLQNILNASDYDTVVVVNAVRKTLEIEGRANE